MADNLAAIAATLDALRAVERHGGARILERAFTGFTALPAPGETVKRTWRQVFGLQPDVKITAETLRAIYRRLAAEHHPDRSGADGTMAELNIANEEAKKEIGARRPTAIPMNSPKRDAVREAVAAALGNAYDCTRVWSAWSCGTVSCNDFQLVAEDDERLDEIVDAAINAMPPSNAAPVIPANADDDADLKRLVDEFGWACAFGNDQQRRITTGAALREYCRQKRAQMGRHG